MHGLTRIAFTLALPLAACGPGTNDADATTTATTTTTTTTESTTTTSTPTTGDPGTTADTATTAEPDTTEVTATTAGFVACPDDALPPAGSPCETDGANCSPSGDLCQPFAVCEGGAWNILDGDPNECSDGCDPFPTEGEPCDVDGTFCNTGCEDQCQFCNILMCSEGVWMNLEAPPAPCLECEELCPFTVMPMCAAGPPDEANCVTGCQATMAGPCNVEFSAARACAGFEPTFTCDAMDRPLVAGCETQFDELYKCLGI
jgi:hypothetical protein